MPYITEEIYQTYYVKNEKIKSIHINNFPKFEKYNEKLKELGEYALDAIHFVRMEKTRENKSLKEHIKLKIDPRLSKLEIFKEDLQAVCNADIVFEEAKNTQFEVGFSK